MVFDNSKDDSSSISYLSLFFQIPFSNIYLNFLLLLFFITFAIIILLYYPYPQNIINADNANSSTYGAVLLSIELAIAIFAINFSFLVYQFSPYRALIHKISTRQILDPLSVLMLSLIPIIFLGININYAPTLAIITIPMVAYGTFLLTMSLSQESDPIYMLEKKLSDTHVNSFLESFSKDISKQLKQVDEKKLLDREDTSWDDFDFKTSPPTKLDDPLNFAASLGVISIENSDFHTFEHVVRRIIQITKLINQFETDYKVKKVLYHYYKDLLVQIATYSFKYNKIPAIKFLDLSALFLRENAFQWGNDSELLSDFNFKILALLTDTMLIITENLLKSNDYDSAMITLLIIKQIASKGIYYMNKYGDADLLFVNYIPYFSSQIKKLGLIAIKTGDEGYLYRCITSLGWLGCSAVKNDVIYVGESCLQSLIHLGRESNRKNIECFDPHCPLKPFDHAEESIEWMSTWICKLDDSKQQKWIDAINTSYSRLLGTITSIEIVLNDENQCTIKKHNSKDPFIEDFFSKTREVKYDFSDKNLKKDLEIRAF